MARVNNPLTADMRGAVGNVIFRVRNGKTFSSKFPDMSRVRASPKRKKVNTRFAKAVMYAQGIIADPVKKAAFKVKKGQSVYHAAIKKYLSEN